MCNLRRSSSAECDALGQAEKFFIYITLWACGMFKRTFCPSVRRIVRRFSYEGSRFRRLAQPSLLGKTAASKFLNCTDLVRRRR